MSAFPPASVTSAVANAAGMGEQMVYRDLVPIIGQLRKMLADVVGKRKALLFDEEENCRGDELLPHRSDVEDRVRAQCNIALEVG